MAFTYPIVSAGVAIKEVDYSNYVAKISNTIVAVVGTAEWGPEDTSVFIPDEASLIGTFGIPPALLNDVNRAKKIGMHGAVIALKRTSQLYYHRVTDGNAAAASYALQSDDPAVVMTATAKYKGKLGNRLRVRISDPVDTTATGTPSKLFQLEILGDIFNTGVYSVLEKYGTVSNEAADVTAVSSATLNTFRYTTYLEINKVSKFVVLSIPDPLPADTRPANTNLTTYPAGNPLTGGNNGDDAVTDNDIIGSESAGTGLYAFADRESIDVNILWAPGWSGSNCVVWQKLTEVVEGRRDCVALYDAPDGLTAQQFDDFLNAAGSYTSNYVINSSYAAGPAYPWTLYADNYNKGEQINLPPGCGQIFAIGETDTVAGPHWAPMGVVRGRLTYAIGPVMTLKLGHRELLQGAGHIGNPIIKMGAYGTVMWGQKTGQRHASALDRINVRRMLNVLEKSIAAAVVVLIGEFNDPLTWLRFKAICNPALAAMLSARGITQYKLVCDATTNTADAIANKELRGSITVIPNEVAERIVITFIVDRASNTVTFNEFSQAA